MAKKVEISFPKQGDKYRVNVLLDEENAAYVARRCGELGLPASRVVNLCVEFDRFSITSEGAAKCSQLLRRLGGLKPEALEALLSG